MDMPLGTFCGALLIALELVGFGPLSHFGLRVVIVLLAVVCLGSFPYTRGRLRHASRGRVGHAIWRRKSVHGGVARCEVVRVQLSRGHVWGSERPGANLPKKFRCTDHTLQLQAREVRQARPAQCPACMSTFNLSNTQGEYLANVLSRSPHLDNHV